MKRETMIAMVVVGLLAFGSAFWVVEKKVGTELDKENSAYLKDQYMVGCTEDSYGMTKYCSCTYDALEKEVGIDGIIKIGIQYTQEYILPDEVWDAIKDCAKYLN